MCCSDDIDSLITATYAGISECAKPDKYFAECTLLLCKNDDVDDLNKAILARMGQMYPVEYLNSLTCSGLPLAQLILKPGCSLMLYKTLIQPMDCAIELA